MTNGVPQLITPQTQLRDQLVRLLHPIKNLTPGAMVTLVLRSPTRDPAVPDGVLLLSEETDTDLLCNAINHAAAINNANKAKG